MNDMVLEETLVVGIAKARHGRAWRLHTPR